MFLLTHWAHIDIHGMLRIRIQLLYPGLLNLHLIEIHQVRLVKNLIAGQRRVILGYGNYVAQLGIRMIPEIISRRAVYKQDALHSVLMGEVQLLQPVVR